MKNLEGSICLISIPQSDGKQKIRPVLLLRQFPPFGDYLVCGISTQTHQFIKGFDELLADNTPDFFRSVLREASLISLGFLSMIESNKITGSIGRISRSLWETLLSRLADYLNNNEPKE